ncbi:MAG TPA: hypothetical protein VF613_21385, partial [Longimicrobium sp.]
KDLLDRWLAANNRALIWNVGGERRRRLFIPGSRRDVDDGPHYREFRVVHRYLRGRPEPAR